LVVVGKKIRIQKFFGYFFIKKWQGDIFMKDARVSKLAKGLVGYSIQAKKGEKVLIEAYEVDSFLVTELVKEVYAVGAYPFVSVFDTKVQRALLNGTTKEHQDLWIKYDAARMADMDCYIGIRGGKNSFESSDVSSEKMALHGSNYGEEVHGKLRVKKTRWVILRYPNESMAQLASMSTEAFEDYYFDVCNLDYSKMDKAMDALVKLMDKTDKVRIIGKDTDLRFSIKGIPSVKCSGRINIPDGEVFTAPVKDSVEGYITYNCPSINQGVKFENVRLEFEKGKIVKFSGNHYDRLEKIFNTDEGARYIGEFAIGVNPFITQPIGDILFDEKIRGSIHFTPGASYDEASNGNKSAVHWDLILLMTPDCGGGEIWFDDVLVRKDGEFVIKELKGLNPDGLK